MHLKHAHRMDGLAQISHVVVSIILYVLAFWSHLPCNSILINFNIHILLDIFILALPYCEELAVMNGEVFYTHRFYVGSIASYICNKGYIPGDAMSRTRMCTSYGWSGSRFSCSG